MIDSKYDQYEAQSACPIANTYTNDEVFRLLAKFTDINIEQHHIFPYKIPDYIQNAYVKEDWFEVMPPKMFQALENAFGWHLCITAHKPLKALS
jgi:hypothetical protein